MTCALEVKHLSFTYPDGMQALSDFSLNVERGQRVALIGPNGAGKSTFLLHLNGILQGKGEIRGCGLPADKANLPRIRALVGMLFQSPDDQLFSPTVFEDVAYGPIYQGLPRDVIEGRVDEALASVNMSAFKNRVPYHMSIGEKKKICLASVLSMQPEILVLDEPSAGLDPRARRSLIHLLMSLPQTMLIATHDLEMVRALTRRTILINQGIIVADGENHLIFSNERLLIENVF